MTPERWSQITKILDQALDLAADRREDFLARACGDDPGLRTQVEAFLAAANRSHGVLDEPLGAAQSAPGLQGQRFGPYQAVRFIEGGGMGMVYEAVDDRLHRRVALKLLPPEWSRDQEAKRRFLREARAAAALDHPNTCAVYDIGESEDGQLYIVMAYYQGETLKQKLDRGPLLVPEARDIAIQIARGLARAHESGVTHRDIKPANVMITDRGEAKVLDFGIAKLADEAGLTRTGPSPGTPAYMSPEQAHGHDVDHRTDIWSLGAVVYEMLAGRRAFRGATSEAVIYSILHSDPERIHDAPESLQEVLRKTLAKDPGKRYRNLDELIRELGGAKAPGWLAQRAVRRRLAGAAILALAFSLAGAWIASRSERAGAPQAVSVPVPAETAVVGVVPFVNLTGEEDLAWYGEGIASLLRDALTRSRHLQVVSARRVESLSEAPPTEQAVRAAAAGITVLITGELLGSREGLTVAGRVTELEEGRQLAATRVDGLVPEDVLRAVEDLAREARKGLGIPPREAVDVFAVDFAADNPRAYGCFLKGMEAFAEYRYDVAEQEFSEALAIAPGFVMARFRLAHVQAVTGRTVEALENIRGALAEAGRLPDRDARYIRALEAYIDRRYDEAKGAYRQIIAVYPYETDARYQLAQVLYGTGHYEEELNVLDELALLEPENHVTWSMMGEARVALGQFHEAVLALHRYIELEPSSANGRHLLADAYRAQGELDIAAEEYSDALRIDSTFHFSTVALAITEVLRDHPERAEGLLSALLAESGVPPRQRLDAVFELASLYRSQGRFKKAIAILESNAELIAAEKVREAMALSLRGLSRMELADESAAQRWIDLAVERSPGVPTRYLFARGLLELRREQGASLETTIGRILQGALPPDVPDRTEEKAAAYLLGLHRLQDGRVEEAIDELSRAVALDGYEYALYRLALARAYLAAGQLDLAMAAARQASAERDLAKPRLDLELDRGRALLVLARVHEAMGRPTAAAELAREFFDNWALADGGLPDLGEARRLKELDR